MTARVRQAQVLVQRHASIEEVGKNQLCPDVEPLGWALANQTLDVIEAVVLEAPHISARRGVRSPACSFALLPALGLPEATEAVGPRRATTRRGGTCRPARLAALPVTHLVVEGQVAVVQDGAQRAASHQVPSRLSALPVGVVEVPLPHQELQRLHPLDGIVQHGRLLSTPPAALAPGLAIMLHPGPNGGHPESLGRCRLNPRPSAATAR